MDLSRWPRLVIQLLQIFTPKRLPLSPIINPSEMPSDSNDEVPKETPQDGKQSDSKQPKSAKSGDGSSAADPHPPTQPLPHQTDNIIVVLESDLKDRTFLANPPGFNFRYMHVPDPRVAFIMMFSDAEFEVWKASNPHLVLHEYTPPPSSYPHPNMNMNMDMNVDLGSVEINEIVASGIDGAPLELRSVDVDVDVDTRVNEQGQGQKQGQGVQLPSAISKAFDLIRYLTLQLATAGKELARAGSSQSQNEQGKTGDAKEEAAKLIPPDVDGKSAPRPQRKKNPEKRVPKATFFPKSRVVRRFLIKRFINQARNKDA